MFDETHEPVSLSRNIEASTAAWKCGASYARPATAWTRVNRQITLRYVGPERTAMFLQELEGINLVYARLEPGKLRVWDFADEEVFQ